MRMRRHNMARVTIKAPYPVCLFFYFFCSLVIRSFRPTFQICVPATAISGRQHLRSAATTGSTRPDCNWTTKFRSQWTNHTEPSATSTTVTGPVGERLQAGAEDAPVLDRSAPLRRLRDSGAGYKYPDSLTYLIFRQFSVRSHAVDLAGHVALWLTR